MIKTTELAIFLHQIQINKYFKMKNEFHILLDNGHGENTPGKRSPIWSDGTQLFEYKFNRCIVEGIAKRLKELNILHEIIVPEIKDISLSERVKRINKYSELYGTRNCLMISIHANAGGGTGWECYTTIGKTNSDIYAELFYEAAEWMWDNDNDKEKRKIRYDLTDGDKDKEANFTIIYGAKCPAILTENFFMDTYKDCKYIQSIEGQEDIIEMHIDGILKSLKYWNDNINK